MANPRMISIHIRVSADVVARIDALAAAKSEETHVEIPRPLAFRAALVAGVDALERRTRAAA